MKDRRKDLRPATRLQLISIAGGLSSQTAADLERVMTGLYVGQPLRWQTFMDEAQVLMDAIADDRSGFEATVAPDPSE